MKGKTAVMLCSAVLLALATPAAGVPNWFSSIVASSSDDDQIKLVDWSSLSSREITPIDATRTFFGDIPQQAELFQETVVILPSRQHLFAGDRDDEFIIPIEYYEETPSSSEHESVPMADELMADLRHFAVLVLGWLGLNRQANTGCNGGDRNRNRNRNINRSNNRNRRGNRDNRGGDNPSIFDKFGEAVSGLMTNFGEGIMDAFGMDGHSNRSNRRNRSNRIRSNGNNNSGNANSNNGNGNGNGNDRTKESEPKRDMDLLTGDLDRLQLCNYTKAMVGRILTTFLGMYPAVGYSQGFDYACIAILTALGNDEGVVSVVFNDWAASAGGVITDEARRQNAAHYAFEQSSRATKEFLMADSAMDLHDLSNNERAATLYIHLFANSVSSMCARLQLPETVQEVIITKSRKAGVDAAGVSVWVTMALLSMAMKDPKLSGDKDMSKGKLLKKAAEGVSTFSDLENAAGIALPSFMKGYRKALRG